MQLPRGLTDFLHFPDGAVATFVLLLHHSISVRAVWPIDVDSFNFLSAMRVHFFATSTCRVRIC
jgi:hypothetical protein